MVLKVRDLLHGIEEASLLLVQPGLHEIQLPESDADPDGFRDLIYVVVVSLYETQAFLDWHLHQVFDANILYIISNNK